MTTFPDTKPEQMLSSALLVIIAVLSVLGTCVGSVAIGFKELLQVFLPSKEILPDYISMIVLSIRLPRVIMALLIGMMLSSSGTVVQAVFHNPLADPYIIGISASAVAGAVVAFLLGLPQYMFGPFAFAASAVTSFFIFRISSMNHGRSKVTMLLIIGVAVSSFLGAFTSFAMYSIGEDSYQIIVWTMGYLGSASWPKIGMIALPLAASIIFYFYYRQDLDALMLGDEEAHSLGIPVGKLKKKLLLISCLTVSFSVAFSGMIGFVGLIIPHITRLLIGHSNGKIILPTALGGGMFLLLSDIIARTVIAPVEIPIGAVTAFFGAPFFIYLAIKNKRGISL